MLSDYIDIARTRYQERFAFYRNDDMIGFSICHYGEYQQIELDLLLQLINEKTVVYDIGSNIGYHASAFASKSRNVHCFEANPEHYKILKLNLQENPRCHLYNMALGNTDGTVLVETFDPLEIKNYGAVRVGVDHGTRVSMRALDNVTTMPGPHLIKLDVEGHELPVLQGAYNLIKEHLPVIYFEAQETLDLPEIHRMLTELNYQLKWVCVRNYNSNNFYNNADNYFKDSAIFSILAYQPGAVTVELEDVQGADDSWEKLLARHNN